ncbi:MAG: septal ring lytic transglycosylase RlpA family protein [Gammaproteobacteria bacterium]|nr:septal ring lytic transglycosylase RlpA family protein [Gammaproteobacteria bacterium]
MSVDAHLSCWKHLTGYGVILLLTGLTACSTPKVFEPSDAAPANPRDVSNVQNAVPRAEAHSRYGNPDSYVVYGKRYHTRKSSQGYKEKGGASWYGTKFHGRRTSSGEPYDMYAMTAAHKTLPLPSYVEVTNLDNGRKVIVRVNDRGPFHDGRIIDMSYAAAVKLGMVGKGTAHVEVRAIDPRTQAAAPAPKKTSTTAATSRASAPSQPVAATAPATQTATTAVPVPASAPPVRIINAPLFLQVGAFASLINAERLRSDIADQNIGAVRIVEADTDNGKFFKVQVGPLADHGEAERIAQTLKPLGINAARTVVD